MRRSVWKKIPYKEIQFGEDQVWASDIIEAGYDKVYAVRAAVYHSHDFDLAENRERNMTEAAFFKHFFGYKLVRTEEELERNLLSSNTHDEAWGKAEGLSPKEIKTRLAQNEARLRGYLDGYLTDTSTMF